MDPEKKNDQEIIMHLYPKDYETVCNLQKELKDNRDKLKENVDKLDIYINGLKTSSDKCKEVMQEIFVETVKNRNAEFEKIFNKKARLWCLCTIGCLLAIAAGIVICLIFNNRCCCLKIEDTSLYCLTAICIVSIIGCIIVHKEYTQSKWINDTDS